MSTISDIKGVVTVDWDVNTEQIAKVRKNNLLSRFNEYSHNIRLRVKDGENWVDPSASSMAATLFLTSASGALTTIIGSTETVTIGSESGKVFTFSLTNASLEQGKFRMDIRVEKSTVKRTAVIIEGNVL